MSEKFDACIENPYSHKCGISYNPTDETSWSFSFWVELRDVIVWWDRNSRRDLGMNDDRIRRVENNYEFPSFYHSEL